MNYNEFGEEMIREIVGLTKELMRFPTTHSKPREIGRCAVYIEHYLDQIPVRYRRFDIEGIPSILVLPKNDYAPVLLMSHMDVVAAPDELFEPVERDGRIYGRGSIDDKYAVALSLVLLKTHMQRLLAAGKGQKDLGFGILITGDEELGGFMGAQKVLKTLRTDFCIALDGGSPKEIVMKEKGILQVKLTSRGKAAHASRPWLGENAIEKLLDDYLQIKELFRVSAENHWHRTMNLGIIHGGESANQVPDRAEAILDIRYTENDNVEELVEAIKKRIQCDLEVTMKEPIFYGREGSHLDRLLQLAPGATLGMAHGASDARHLSAYGLGGIVWGAQGNNSQHSLDEHVEIDSILDLFLILDRFLGKNRP